MDKSRAYEVLGLAEGASEQEVKAAYRALAQKYNADNYDAGPLKDEAEAHMSEINEAFDVVMGFLRTGTEATPAGRGAAGVAGRYPAIRALINSGQVDEALAELQALPDTAADAEWNFLMGSAFYYKGWLDRALVHFQAAVRLAPGNPEYEAALRNLQGAAEGDMQGNPYGQPDPGGNAVNCACNMCSFMCCMDACCGLCRGY